MQLGVTAAASTATSSEEAIKERPRMIEALDSDFPAETPQGIEHRKKVLAALERVVNEWTFEVGTSHAGLDEETARQAGAKIFLFGSSKLGVLNPGSDIDCVCVTPKHITRDHFFQLLLTKLQEKALEGTSLAHDPVNGLKIENLVAVQEAHTPLIAMDVEGVPVDLGFAQLQIPTLRGLFSLEEDSLLLGLDEKSARGIGGNRVNEAVLKLVPNQETFREALRLIKAWAKARGLSSNMQGFFGGITWAILVARICQLYPHFNCVLIVARFFKIYTQWPWGHLRPVILTEITQVKDQKLSHLKVWDPKTHIGDKQHLMPIVTPSFPAMNSTHNVSLSTKETLIAEFKRGHNIVQNILAGTASWQSLYRRCPFFSQHEHYLRLVLLSKTEKSFNAWEGFFQSKLRRIIQLLEQHIPNIHVRPFPDLFECDAESIPGNTQPQQSSLENSVTHCTYPIAKQMFVGLNFRQEFGFQNAQTVDLRAPIEKFVEFLIGIWRGEGKEVDSVNLLIAHCLREELPGEVVAKHPGMVDLLGEEEAAVLNVGSAVKKTGGNKTSSPETARKSSPSRASRGGSRSRKKSTGSSPERKSGGDQDGEDLEDLIASKPAKKAKKEINVSLVE